MTDPFPRGYQCLPSQSFAQGGFSLRSVQPGDIEAIRLWRNAQMDVLRQAAPISESQQRAYFARHVWPAFAEARPANILLSFLQNGEQIGYGGLVHVAWEHSRAEVSFLLKPDLAADAEAYMARFTAYLGLIKKIAFAGLGLHRLFTETYAFRTAHLSALEGAGFALEGRMRDHVIVNGSPIDSLLHGCLEND